MSYWIVPLAILIAFEFIADVFAKQYSLEPTKLYWAAISLLGYMLANTAWLIAIRNGSGLGRGAVIFSVASAILAVGIGFLMYHETISRTQSAGVVLGIVALVLIFWK